MSDINEKINARAKRKSEKIQIANMAEMIQLVRKNFEHVAFDRPMERIAVVEKDPGEGLHTYLIYCTYMSHIVNNPDFKAITKNKEPKQAIDDILMSIQNEAGSVPYENLGYFNFREDTRGFCQNIEREVPALTEWVGKNQYKMFSTGLIRSASSWVAISHFIFPRDKRTLENQLYHLERIGLNTESKVRVTSYKLNAHKIEK